VPHHFGAEIIVPNLGDPGSAFKEAALKRFKTAFNKEIDQKKIQYWYNRYIKRLHDYKRAGGQMTTY
jgi:hypothetical protein